MMNYFKKIIIPLFLLAQCAASGQTDTAKISRLIDSLSWNSVSINCMGGILVLTHEDSTENELVKIGKPATERLMEALSNPAKTIIAHIILTEIWGSEFGQDYFATEYIYRNCNQSVGWRHIYNGLVWGWSDENTNGVKQTEIDKIKNYWTEKIAGNEISFDNEKILRQLEKQDSIDYPCYKIYENNSSFIKYDELAALPGLKNKNSTLTAFLKKLGNDSIIIPFDDCFFVTYRRDGLTFRFEKNNRLSMVFIEEGYNGELPLGLKLKDQKPVIEKKLGKPTRSGSYAVNSWSFYKAQKLHFEFDKEGKIISLGVSKKR